MRKRTICLIGALTIGALAIGALATKALATRTFENTALATNSSSMPDSVEDTTLSPDKSVMEKAGDYVYLEFIEPPKWGEDFATIDDGEIKSVSWGASDDGAYFCESAGFPGFDKPIVIVGDFSEKDQYVVQTTYGTYYYVFAKVESAKLDSTGSQNLIDKNTGENLINFSISEETLYLYNPETETVISAHFDHGTEIKIAEVKS